MWLSCPPRGSGQLIKCIYVSGWFVKMEIRNIKIGTPIQTIMSKDVLRISLKHLRIFSLNTKIRRFFKKECSPVEARQEIF